MTAALLAPVSSDSSGNCRFPWCAGMHCAGDDTDKMHQGRDTTVHDDGWNHDLLVRPMNFEWDDDTTSGPIVEFAINDAYTGCGTYVNCPPEQVRAVGTALQDAVLKRSGIGQVVTIDIPDTNHVSGGVITVERLDEVVDLGPALSGGHHLVMPLIRVTARGGGETEFEECKVLDADAYKLGRSAFLAADEVTGS